MSVSAETRSARLTASVLRNGATALATSLLVLATGPGRRSENTGELIPLDLAVGDTVIYSKYGGTEILVEGEDLLILTSRDVLAKVIDAGGKKKK